MVAYPRKVILVGNVGLVMVSHTIRPIPKRETESEEMVTVV